MAEEKGFFDANPKMIFVFGLAVGIACVLIFVSLDFSFLKNSDSGTPIVSDVTDPIDTGEEDPELFLAPLSEQDQVRGDVENARVVLVEYSDLECPYCQGHHENMLKIVDDYGDDVAWVFRHFPLTNIHPQAVPAALAAECAGEQDKFWEFNDEMFANQTLLGDTLYTDTASKLGLDAAQFSECYESQKYLDKVMGDQQTGIEAGVNGTPATFINGLVVSGARDAEVRAAIDYFLEQK